MKKQTAVGIFETLSSGIRLDVYRLLMKAGAEGMVAGQVSSALDLPPANLSFHLKAMLQANLVTVRQEGRFLRYRANVPHMLRVLAYVMENCARSDDGECVRVRGAAKAPAPQVLAPQAPATPP